MQIDRWLIAATATLICLSGNAVHAQWRHEVGERNPFKGGPEHAAGYADDMVRTKEMFLFTCNTADNVELAWQTRRRVSYDAHERVRRASFRIALIVDDKPAIYARARGGVVDFDKLAVFASDPKEVSRLAVDVASASKGVAAAVEMDGKIEISTPFPLGAAPVAVGAMVKGCKLYGSTSGS